jgi:hypothetical protein
MKKFYLFLFILTALFATNLSVAQNSVAFLFKADSSTITNNRCIIDTPHTNSKDMVYPIFTHNYNPGGAPAGLYVNQVQGLYYHANTWRIFNQNLSAFTPNSAYNVLVPSADMLSWEHEATNANISFNQTEIDHPAINGDSNAVVLVSHMWKGKYSDKVIGVFYKHSTNKWNIFFEEGTQTPMEENLKFNVVIAKNKPNYEAMQVKANVSNTVGHIMKIDHPDLNANPDAFVFVTQNYNVGGGTGKYNNHNIGVYYNGVNWTVYNEDFAPIPEGAGFNLIFFHNKNISISENRLNDNEVKIFPNPVEANSKVTLRLENSTLGHVNVKLYDMSGVCVLNTLLESNSNSLNAEFSIPELNRGIYVVQVENNGRVGTQKLYIR